MVPFCFQAVDQHTPSPVFREHIGDVGDRHRTRAATGGNQTGATEEHRHMPRHYHHGITNCTGTGLQETEPCVHACAS